MIEIINKLKSINNIKWLILQSWDRFIGNGHYHLLYIISILIFLIIIKDTDKRKKIFFIFYTFIILFLNLCPYFAKIIVLLFDETDTYWRVYWMLPVGIGIAYVFTEIITKSNNTIKQLFITIIIIFIIYISGSNVFLNNNLSIANNYEKLPDDMIDIVNYLSNLDNDYKKLMGSDIFCTYTRLLDGNIILDEGRHDNTGIWDLSMINYINNHEFEKIQIRCITRNINYIVFEKELFESNNDFIENYKFEKIYENNTYSLYHFDESYMEMNNR